MKRAQLLNLWEMRFEKLLREEKKAAAFYKALLSEHNHLLTGTRVRRVIARIMREEKAHAAIAGQLLDIVKRAQQRREAPEKNHPMRRQELHAAS